MTTLVIATHNAHKVGEIRALLGGRFQFLTLDDFPGVPAVIEDTDTFAGNATKKATELAQWLAANRSRFTIPDSTAFILADDSGLEVDALNGAPGVHSARFAAMDKNENSKDTDNNAKLLRLLKDVPAEKRMARFRCVFAFLAMSPEKIENASPVCYANESQAQIFEGVCEGKIIFEPRGKNGFGYDPLFVPDVFDQTFAELGDTVKNRLSHRAQACQKLRQYIGELTTG
jgi:XTP/dITP diphosphohydrolase